MQKTIIIISGVSSGKTAFIRTIKKNGYWTWNLSPKNVLSMISYKVGWNGDQNKLYYEFIEKLENLVNEYFNFENSYINQMVEKFEKHEKAVVLIIHYAKEHIAKRLQEEYENCYTVLISDHDEVNENYARVLNCNSENYTEEILELMNILTKDLTKEN